MSTGLPRAARNRVNVQRSAKCSRNDADRNQVVSAWLREAGDRRGIARRSGVFVRSGLVESTCGSGTVSGSRLGEHVSAATGIESAMHLAKNSAVQAMQHNGYDVTKCSTASATVSDDSDLEGVCNRTPSALRSTTRAQESHGNGSIGVRILDEAWRCEKRPSGHEDSPRTAWRIRVGTPRRPAVFA